MPEADFAADWEDPDPQSRWTLNRTCNVALGAAARPEKNWPCDGPFPCQRAVNGAPAGTFHPNKLSLLSLHNARGRELVGQRGSIGQDLCRRHYGYFTMTAEGRIAPIVFSVPDDQTNDDEIYASIGFFAGRKAAADDPNEPRAADDLMMLCPTNQLMAVATLQLPNWSEGVFDSSQLVCGDPV